MARNQRSQQFTGYELDESALCAKYRLLSGNQLQRQSVAGRNKGLRREAWREISRRAHEVIINGTWC